MREKENLTLLGNQQNNYETDYNPDLLETFVNKHPENDYFVKFNCPEFTSLCPITGQPDFANIIISYVPGERMVESKSLKLYLFSFRNHGDFHEDCVNVIMKDLIKLMEPKYIEVWGNSHLVAESPLIHTAIMGSQELSGKMWHLTVWQIMICIRRRWIIGKEKPSVRFPHSSCYFLRLLSITLHFVLLSDFL